MRNGTIHKTFTQPYSEIMEMLKKIEKKLSCLHPRKTFLKILKKRLRNILQYTLFQIPPPLNLNYAYNTFGSLKKHDDIEDEKREIVVTTIFQ